MMKTYRQTLLLVAVFFGALLTYWGLQFGGVRTETEKRQREGRVLPELMTASESTIQRVEIERDGKRLVFERRGTGFGRWQMVEPLNVAAEPTRLETLVRNLKDLHRFPDASAMTDQEAFGLDPPRAKVSLWGTAEGSEKTSIVPLATLEVGKTIRGARYVRGGGSRGIEAVDSKLLAALDEPIADWREHVVMGVPTFQVTALKITRPDQVIRAERGSNGQWRLLKPLSVPANGAKIESLLAALASLRVTDGEKGFVADDVQDLARFGLTTPAVSVELVTNRPSSQILVLHVGKEVPDLPDRVYVRQGDQNDVVMVDAKALGEIPKSALALRSQQVSDFRVAEVSRIQVQSGNQTYSLKRDSTGWRLSAPREEKADQGAVNALLERLDSLQTSEFLDPRKVRNAQVDPPLMTIKIWQISSEEPALALRIGHYDLARKAIYAQLENDDVILALPDTLLPVLPKNQFAFRDRTILSHDPAQVRKLIITRAGRTDELEPSATGGPNQWKMVRPVRAPADVASITRALAVLANLHAEDLVSDSPGDLPRFGLDHPLLEVSWETDRTHRLKIGAPVPKTSNYCATVVDQPYIFTLTAQTVSFFDAEFRDHTVCSFPEARAERVLLRWPHRTVALKRRSPAPAKGQSPWVDEPGFDAGGIDLSRASALVSAMANLETIRFFQYEGPIGKGLGLTRPRLVVQVELGAGAEPKVLRIGWSTESGLVFAATGTADSGPVFFLPAMAWDALIQSGERFPPLPDDVFAPGR
jgi:hypothetical protein